MKIQNLEMTSVGGKHKLVAFVDLGKVSKLISLFFNYAYTDCNRQFIKLHFKNNDPAESKFVTTTIYTGGPMIFHNIKKIRNNIKKSNKNGKPQDWWEMYHLEPLQRNF
ncbi:unnamed protein product [Porites evermanni]|uniref:Uncharacterized protein n=1 Tax=Porites evermanni TaxID=104178 RepID=A0ABN8MIW2_9CNID|nr:unnamed protein product [Porites evermanni]